MTSVVRDGSWDSIAGILDRYQRRGAGELTDRGLQVDLRAVAQHQSSRGQRIRYGGQPLRDVLDPLLNRVQSTRRSVRKGVGRDWAEWIPLLLAHLGQLEQAPIDVGGENRQIDASALIKDVRIQLSQRVRCVPEHQRSRRNGVGGVVDQLVIQPMIAGAVCDLRAAEQVFLDDAFGEPGVNSDGMPANLPVLGGPEGSSLASASRRSSASASMPSVRATDTTSQSVPPSPAARSGPSRPARAARSWIFAASESAGWASATLSIAL